MVRPYIRIYMVKPSDARGWIGLGCFILVLVVLAMILVKPKLLENDAFLILATAIVVTGWVNGPVGWAYQATKSGGEMAESSARIAEQAASAAVGRAKSKPEPQDVNVVNPPEAPVPTRNAKP
jgi:hypothetical protein